MQSDCENAGVLKDFHFVTLVAFAHHLSSRRIEKTLQNWCPRRPFDIRCVSEALPERVWKDFGLPNGLPKHVIEGSSRLFGPLGAGF